MAEHDAVRRSRGRGRPRGDDESGPPRDLGRYLRVFAGTDERILSWVPTDRARYTGLGGVVLGTSVIAGVSMFLALSEMVGRVTPWLLVPVLVWALFVLNLDRWLVSSGVGSRWSKRARLLLPRLLLAGFFGVIIAEPLVLRVFQPAVEQHIRDGRDAEALALESSLKRCNPVPGEDTTADRRAAASDCDAYRLAPGTTPNGSRSELQGLRVKAASLQRELDADLRTQRDLDDLAVKECNGGTGPNTTGVPGDGPECRLRKQRAREFRDSHPTAARVSELARINARIVGLEKQVGSTSTSYEQSRDAAIAEKVGQLRTNQREIGLLERFRALDELADDNSFLLAATWFVRGFFIVVDCLPVLVKLVGGSSAYDRLVDSQQETAERVQGEAARISGDSVVQTLLLEQHERQSTARKRQEDIDLVELQHAARINGSLDRAVDALAATLLEQNHGRRHPAMSTNVSSAVPPSSAGFRENA